MAGPDEPLAQERLVSDAEHTLLLAEIDALQAENRRLQRQLKKAEAAISEARRAHSIMVETLTDTMRENTVLANERDSWRARAQRQPEPWRSDDEAIDLETVLGVEAISRVESNAIRKAIARLHHPDSGGDPERMKRWNAALDRLER